jgi:hypothetical protein
MENINYAFDGGRITAMNKVYQYKNVYGIGPFQKVYDLREVFMNKILKGATFN